MGNFINLTDSPRVSGGRGRGKASTLLAFLPSAAALSITLSRRVGEHRGQARELVSPQLFTANLFNSRLETISSKIFRFYSLSTTRSITRIIQTDASISPSFRKASTIPTNRPGTCTRLLSRIALSYCEIIKFTFSITKPKKKKNKKPRLVLLSSSSSDRYTIKREIASWKISWREFHFERKPETMLFRREREEKMRGSIT